MAKVQIQFHAAPDEAVSLALGWARDYSLSAVLEQFFPAYRAVRATSDGLSPDLSGFQQIDRVALCRSDPDLAATAAHDFVTRNPGCLFLSIGPHGGDGLRESALAGTTDDQESMRKWRDLIRQAKSLMHTGATVRDPASGAEEHLPQHLHTHGAHNLAAQGVPMLAAAGWNEFAFDDCVFDRHPNRNRNRPASTQ